MIAPDRATYWNVAAPNGLSDNYGPAAVGSHLYVSGRIPWAYSIASPSGFDNLSFGGTLPLDLDLDGPPIPAPYVYVQPYATNGLGNDRWEPTCTWHAQDRTTAPITKAWYRCTFPGHFPAARANPFTQANCRPPNDYQECFDQAYQAADDAGHALFNSYIYSVPLRVVAGSQGAVIRDYTNVWADTTPAVVSTGLPGSSEATPTPIPLSVTVGGRLELVLQKTATSTKLFEGGSMTYTIRFSNTGDVGSSSTQIFDLFARDSRTGAASPGCEMPRFVSATPVSDPPAVIEYTTDNSPTPSGATWLPTLPTNLADVTGLRILPRSLFSATPGEYSPGDAPVELRVTLADTAGAGARLCNSAAVAATGLAPTLATAGPVDVVPACQTHVYGPASDEHGMILFEDRWPSKGDLDFNDQAVTYNQDLVLDENGEVTEMLATFNVLAVGASLHNGLYLHLPLPANTSVTAVKTDDAGTQTTPKRMLDREIVFELAPDTRALFTGQTGFLNTEAEAPVSATHAFNVHLTFGSPVALDTSLIPYDVFIARSDDFTHQIHLAQYPGTTLMNHRLFGSNDDRSTDAAHFIDQHGLPFALSVPSSVHWPLEKHSIDLGYPDLAGFAASGGLTNKRWYETNIQSAQLYTHGSHGALPPAPLFVGPGLTGACPH